MGNQFRVWQMEESGPARGMLRAGASCITPARAALRVLMLMRAPSPRVNAGVYEITLDGIAPSGLQPVGTNTVPMAGAFCTGAGAIATENTANHRLVTMCARAGACALALPRGPLTATAETRARKRSRPTHAPPPNPAGRRARSPRSSPQHRRLSLARLPATRAPRPCRTAADGVERHARMHAAAWGTRPKLWVPLARCRISRS